MWKTMFETMNKTIAAIGQMQQASTVAALRGMELTANTYASMWGRPTEEILESDRRFKEDAWQENQAANLMKQGYLITAQWMEDMANSLETIDPDIHHRTKFWTKQISDAFSPSNFMLTNPVVMQEIVRTGGANLQIGFQNLLEDLQRGRVSHTRKDAFQVGVDLANTPGEVVFRNPLIELIQYTPTTKKVHAVPMLMIPPWINKYYVMDMRPSNSMYKYLVDAGFTVFTISWKNPDESVVDLDWNDYVELGPLEAQRVVKTITGSEVVNTVGYCLGGIIEQTTLAYLTATGDESVNSATFFATHQDFTNAGDVTVFIDEPQIQFLEWLMNVGGGFLDGRNLYATFNMLRANDLLWNYVIHNYMLGKTPPDFDLLYWNSDNTRVAAKVHMYLIREFFMGNKLIQKNGLKVKGVGIDIGQIQVPTYTVAAMGDHIVPWDGTFLMRELMGGPVRFILTTGGHIAGIINHPDKKRREYWTNDDPTTNPEAWLSGADHFEGSWWVDWIPWLEERSGGKTSPPSMGNEEFEPITDAPGTYVLEE
jgi:polyhydroxyalkanoate synthase